MIGSHVTPAALSSPHVPPEVLAQGAIAGIGTGLLACGLVLCFRASRVLNLAHGAIGVVCAVAMAVLVQRVGVAYWPAFALALAAGAALSASVELVVVRRLRLAPPLMTLVATVGVAQVLGLLSALLEGELLPATPLPEPPGIGPVGLGVLTIPPSRSALLVLGPSAALGLAWLLGRSALGLKLRAAAANPDAARTIGVAAGRAAAATWALAGALAALTAVLLLPGTPGGAAVQAQTLGSGLLLRALAAAAIARMSSLPVALVAGTALGIVEQVAIWNETEVGAAELVLFAVLLLVVAAHPKALGRRASAGSWTAFGRPRPLPGAMRRLPIVRWVAAGSGALAFALAALAPLVVDPAAQISLGFVACLALVGLSVWVVSGLAGELSLAQLTLAGVGALCAAWAGAASGSPVVGLLCAVAAGSALAVAVGLPGLRTPAVGLAVATLGLSLAANAWLFPRDWALGTSGRVVEPLGAASTTGRYGVALAGLALALLAVGALARGPLGRRLLAARDNPDAARALGLDPRALRLQALAIGGALAGLAGALLANLLGRADAGAFPASGNIDAVAIAVLGGLGLVAGPVLGALYIVALPRFVDLSTAALAASASGWLLLVLYFPGGLAALAEPVRRRGLTLVLALAGHDPDEPPQPVVPARRRPPVRPRPLPGGGPVLEIVALHRRFGGVAAVDGFGLTLSDGETVGLIGPNGAGKTTVVDLAAGFARPDGGRIRLFGEDVTRLAPQRRAARGLVRSFQDAALFPTLTVEETVRVALNRSGASRDSPANAAELIGELGLGAYARHQVRELSTGTRRIVELAAVVALRPRVLLLDEPSAGISQTEVAGLRDLIEHIREEFGLALLLVEQDLELAAGLADRLVAMVAGRAVADGAPAEVLADRAVVAALSTEAMAEVAR